MRLLFLFLTFSSFLFGGEALFVPHLPQDSDSFKIEIVVENRLTRARQLGFQPMNQSGVLLTPTVLVVEGSSRKTFNAEELFGQQDVSHFIVKEEHSLEYPAQNKVTGLLVAINYSLAGNPNNSSMVTAVANPSRIWRLYPGDWQHVFDGIAVANVRPCSGGNLTLKQYSAAGELLLEQELVSAGTSWGKYLLTLNQRLSHQAGSYIDIVGSDQIAVTGLRGSFRFDRNDSFLVGNLATPLGYHDALKSEAEVQLAKWNAAGLGDYICQMNILCFCDPDLTEDITLRVRQEWIESYDYTHQSDRTVPHGYRQYFLPVSKLFALIFDAIEEDAYEITVTYHEDLGYPTSVYIDPEPCLADEEKLYRITELYPIRKTKEK